MGDNGIQERLADTCRLAFSDLAGYILRKPCVVENVAVCVNVKEVMRAYRTFASNVLKLKEESISPSDVYACAERITSPHLRAEHLPLHSTSANLVHVQGKHPFKTLEVHLASGCLGCALS